MNYRIVEKQGFTVVGPVLHTSAQQGENLKAIPAFWQRANQDGTVERLASEAGPLGLLGICYDYNPRTNAFKYMIGIEAPPRGPVPAAATAVHIPAATFAVFESVGAMPKAIQAVWKRVFSEWFPASGYEHGQGPEIEVYPRDGGDPTSDTYRCEVWIPVRRKS